LSVVLTVVRAVEEVAHAIVVDVFLLFLFLGAESAVLLSRDQEAEQFRQNLFNKLLLS